MNDFLNDRIPQLIAIITKEIRSREDKKKKWAKFKRDNNQELRDLLEIPVQADVRAGDLLGFDIVLAADPKKNKCRQEDADSRNDEHRPKRQ